jgi:hypothetical protein
MIGTTHQPADAPVIRTLKRRILALPPQRWSAGRDGALRRPRPERAEPTHRNAPSAQGQFRRLTLTLGDGDGAARHPYLQGQCQNAPILKRSRIAGSRSEAAHGTL